MPETDTWEALATRLAAHGVPKKRARVVALVASGRTHAEVADELSLSNRGEVGTHVQRYRDRDLANARWLADHAPDI